MGFQTLQFDVLQRGRWQDSAGQVQSVGQRGFAMQFVNRRASHHPAHRDLSAHGGNHERVSVFQPLEIRSDAVQQQVVGIHFFNQLLAAIVFQIAQRAALQ